jgi:hypothetical protein
MKNMTNKKVTIRIFEPEKGTPYRYEVCWGGKRVKSGLHYSKAQATEQAKAIRRLIIKKRHSGNTQVVPLEK